MRPWCLGGYWPDGTKKTEPGRAVCGSCGKEVSVVREGRLRAHRGPERWKVTS